MSASPPTNDEIREALVGWRGRRATIILEGPESRLWLARFDATIHELDDDTTLQLSDTAAGEPEQWVTIPSHYDRAHLHPDHLSITWSQGTVTVRLWRRAIPDEADGAHR